MTSRAAAPQRKKRTAVTFDMNDPAFDAFRVEQKLRKSHGVRQANRKLTEKQTASASSEVSNASTLVDPDARQPDADIKAKGEGGFLSNIYYAFSRMICGSSGESNKVCQEPPVNTNVQPSHVDPPTIETSSEPVSEYVYSPATTFFEETVSDNYIPNEYEMHDRKLRKTLSNETIVVKPQFEEVIADEIPAELLDHFNYYDTSEEQFLNPSNNTEADSASIGHSDINILTEETAIPPIPVSKSVSELAYQPILDRSRYIHSRVQSEPTIRRPTPEPEKETMQDLIEASTEFFNVSPKQPKSMAQSVVLRRWETGRKQRWERWKSRREELLMVEEARRRRRRGFLRRLEMHPWVESGVTTAKPGLSRSISLQIQKKPANSETAGRVGILSRLRTYNKEEEKDDFHGEKFFERNRRVLKRSVSLGSYKELKSRWEPTRRMLCEYDGDGEEEIVKSGTDLFGLALIGSYWNNVPISPEPAARQTPEVIKSSNSSSSSDVDDDDSDVGSDCSDTIPRHQCFEGNEHSGMLDPPKQLSYWARFNAQDILSTERDKVRELLAESLSQAGAFNPASTPVSVPNPRNGSLIGRLTARLKYLDLD